jgi:hypothetical protein
MPVVFDAWSEQVASEAAGRDGRKQFQQWLEGYSLPPLDNSTEGHTWLLEAAKDKIGLEKTLAHLSSELLQEHRQNRLRSANLDRLLFNLFYLCAGLRKPDVLWSPLLHIFDEKTVPKKNLAAGKGHYQGISLVTAFRAALIQNQAKDWLLHVWCEMLKHTPHDFLQGTPMDGFEGILGLPGEPRKNLVGWALARMSEEIDTSRFQEKQFSYLLESVKTRFKEEKWDFLSLGVLCEWRSWAVKLVGDPRTVLEIEYDESIEDLVYLGSNRVKIPSKWKPYENDLFPIIRYQYADFHQILPEVRRTSPLPKEVAHAMNQFTLRPEQRILYLRKEMQATCRSIVSNRRGYNRLQYGVVGEKQ